MMRVFISIDVPEKVKEEIKKIQSQLPEFMGKKTELENLHLTLKFLGEVSEEKVEEIKEKLKEIKFKKFETEIDEIGVFSEKFIRIIWIHLSDCGKLQAEIDNKLKEMFPKEKRFMSHLTIARVKKIDDKNKFLKELKEVKINSVKFLVEDFRLKKSTLRPEGPVYEDLEVYGLE